jgi:hypothetical protein
MPTAAAVAKSILTMPAGTKMETIMLTVNAEYPGLSNDHLQDALSIVIGHIDRKPVKSIPANSQAVYAGRQLLGWTVQHRGAFQAIKFDWIGLGSFETVALARAALWCGVEVSHG